MKRGERGKEAQMRYMAMGLAALLLAGCGSDKRPFPLGNDLERGAP